MTASPLARVVGVVVCLIAAAAAPAAVSVPPLFSDHMVLQRDKEVPVWGKAAAGEKITVTYAGKTADATADDKGEWSTKLPPVKVGNATSLTIAGDKTDKPLVFEDVIPGDVWIASGQSNMQFQVKNAKNAEAEMAAAKFPNIRFYRVPLVTSTQPTKELKGAWAVVTPKTVGECTAVGYYFAR